MCERAQELCERRGGRPGLPVPNTNSPYGLCGRRPRLNDRALSCVYKHLVYVFLCVCVCVCVCVRA